MAQLMRAPVDYLGETQGYRSSRNPNHYGIDLGWNSAHGGPHHPILATSNCEVVKAGKASDGALHVVTRTDNIVEGKYVYCLFWHLNQIDVKKGQALKMGDRIGTMGMTGNSTGVHLHFEVWVTPLTYTAWKLSDKTKYAVDPHSLAYCYADQIEGPDTAPKFMNTTKALADGIKDAEIAHDAWGGVVAATAGLNVRTGPGTDHEVITAIPYNSEVTIVTEQDGWGKLTAGGWVCLQYVRKKNAIKEGDRVQVASNAVVYGTSYRWHSWVYGATFFVRKVVGDKATIAPAMKGACTGDVDVKYLMHA